MFPAIRKQFANERGFGLVGAMLVVALLAILAAIITAIAVNERRSAFNDVLHSSSLIAADSGTEQAIAWLMLQSNPPLPDDLTTRQVGAQGLADMGAHANQRFEYSLSVGLNAAGQAAIEAPPIGYSDGYMLVSFDVASGGEAGREGRSDVAVIVAKLFSTGYSN